MPFDIIPAESLAADSWRWMRWFSKITEVGTWTPTFTGLTEVLGAGSIAYAGRWQRVQRMVHFTVTITPSGGATFASVAGTTYHDLPFVPAQPSCSLMADITTPAGIGTGLITTGNSNYTPTKTATTDALVISGSYEY